VAIMKQFTNRLINETSPYLLQHAHNPVDWYPWGNEAFEKAREENKPVLLSIGYSACHWCHVMAHESFEDEEIAKLMNELFVNIKVDREERPDLDSIYMNAVQMMTHHGGWPMTVFLTPNAVPFYGGTYFPPQDRYNMPGFPRVLISVSEAFRVRPTDIAETSTSLLSELRRMSASSTDDQAIENELLDAAYLEIVRAYDAENGGFGGAPKFPPAMSLEFLLRVYVRTGNTDALEMIDNTAEKMAHGGIYDHLAGGFHRYSTDAKWLVPHFEKMLYDNALLSRFYLHYFQLSKSDLALTTATGVLDYVLREMTSPEGGFYSTQDADSEGHEGKFFVWDRAEIINALGERDGEHFCKYFNVTESGNFEGKNILNVTESLAACARQENLSETELSAIIERGKEKLLALRNVRIKPDRDEKILTAWNGLMLASFSEAGAILGRADYTNAARKNADFLLDQLRRDGRLLRTFKDGVAKLNAYLEDYAFLAEGLLTLYETTGESKWLNSCIGVTETMVEEFWDEKDGAFYFTGKSHEDLIVRTKDYFDNATPSGNSVAASVLLRLSVLLDKESYRNLGIAVLREIAHSARRYPSGFGYALSVADFLLASKKEIALIAGDRQTLKEFIDASWQEFIPNKVVAGSLESEIGDTPVRLLENRTATEGAPVTAYVCENYTCRFPTTDLRTFVDQLLAK
jgi:uncharacterized protein